VKGSDQPVNLGNLDKKPQDIFEFSCLWHAKQLSLRLVAPDLFHQISSLLLLYNQLFWRCHNYWEFIMANTPGKQQHLCVHEERAAAVLPSNYLDWRHW